MYHCYVSYSNYNCENVYIMQNHSLLTIKMKPLVPRKLVQAQSHLLRPIIYVCYFHAHKCVFLLVQNSFYVHLE
jgi:hypothetical protein